MKKKKRMRSSEALSIKKYPVFSIISIVLLTVFALLLILPLIWGLLSSMKGILDFQDNPLKLPTVWKPENYKTAFTALNVDLGNKKVTMLGLIVNSLKYSVLYAILPFSGSVIVAYGCARYRSKWGTVLYWITIVIMVVPILGGLSSGLQIAKLFRMYDNMLVAAIWNIKPSGTQFLVCYAVFKGIDKSYSEAAFIDGAGNWLVFIKIMLPLAKNILMVYIVTGFIGYWNDWMTAMVYFPSFPTLAYGLYSFQFSTKAEATMIPVKLAGCMIIAAPMLVLYALIKDQLIGKISFGGLKG